MAVLLLLLSLVAAINVAAAATLDVQAGKLSVFDEPVVRCAPALPLGKVDNTTATVAMVGYDVPTNCVGKTAHTTLYASGGSPLGSGTGTVATPSFTIPLAPQASLASYFGTALAVGGLQVGVGGSDVTLHIEIDDWFNGYCGDVTLTNTSPVSVSRTVPVALDTYPLNGEIYNSWGSITTSGVSQFSIGGTIASGASVTGGFCANRTEPPPAGEVTYVVTVTSSSATQYCADVEVFNQAATPVTWTIDIDVSAHHPGGGQGGTVSAWSADTSYNASTSTLTASGVNSTASIPVGGSVEWGYCASGLTPPPPPPGAEFYYTISIANHGGTNYTASVTVTTNSPTPAAWDVVMDLTPYGVPGSISVWDATLTNYTAPNAAVTGISYNKPAIQSGDSVTFGYQASNVVANLPTAADQALSYIVSTQNGGGPGCTRVTVGSTSADWHPWQVQLSLPGFNSAPNVYDGGIGTWDGANKILTVRGDQIEWPLKAGKTQQFRYCS